MKATGHPVARGLGGTTDRGTAGEEEGEDDEAGSAIYFICWPIRTMSMTTVLFLRTGINSTLLFNYFMSPKQ